MQAAGTGRAHRVGDVDRERSELTCFDRLDLARRRESFGEALRGVPFG